MQPYTHCIIKLVHLFSTNKYNQSLRINSSGKEVKLTLVDSKDKLREQNTRLYLVSEKYRRKKKRFLGNIKEKKLLCLIV